VGDLPAGVILQWRKWCLNPRYSVGAEGEAVRQGYANVRFPVLALSVTDDELMTLRGTHSLMSLYENARSKCSALRRLTCRCAASGTFRPVPARA
jgi:predicted alpha/beta hydrolase